MARISGSPAGPALLWRVVAGQGIGDLVREVPAAGEGGAGFGVVEAEDFLFHVEELGVPLGRPAQHVGVFGGIEGDQGEAADVVDQAGEEEVTGRSLQDLAEGFGGGGGADHVVPEPPLVEAGASSSLRKSARKTDVVSTVASSDPKSVPEPLSLSVTRCSSTGCCGAYLHDQPAVLPAVIDVAYVPLLTVPRGAGRCARHRRIRRADFGVAAAEPDRSTLTKGSVVQGRPVAVRVEQTGKLAVQFVGVGSQFGHVVGVTLQMQVGQQLNLHCSHPLPGPDAGHES